MESEPKIGEKRRRGAEGKRRGSVFLSADFADERRFFLNFERRTSNAKGMPRGGRKREGGLTCYTKAEVDETGSKKTGDTRSFGTTRGLDRQKFVRGSNVLPEKSTSPVADASFWTRKSGSVAQGSKFFSKNKASPFVEAFFSGKTVLPRAWKHFFQGKQCFPVRGSIFFSRKFASTNGEGLFPAKNLLPRRRMYFNSSSLPTKRGVLFFRGCEEGLFQRFDARLFPKLITGADRDEFSRYG